MYLYSIVCHNWIDRNVMCLQTSLLWGELMTNKGTLKNVKNPTALIHNI